MYKEIKTIDDTISVIIEFEIETSKRFDESFMYVNVDNGSWAYWLLAKGYVNHANIILMEIMNDSENINSAVLYQVFNEKEEDFKLNDENMIKNVKLIAEYLVETPLYLDKLNKFIEQNNK